MKQQRNHRISDWLYHTTFFTRFYGRMAGRFAVEVLWDDFHKNFLSGFRLAEQFLRLELALDYWR